MEQESGIGGEMVRTKGKQQAESTGTRGINKVAQRKLKLASGRVLAKIVQKALSGDENSLQACMHLSSKGDTEKQHERAPSGFSQAALWEAEPEWNGELSEAMGETGTGIREPES